MLRISAANKFLLFMIGVYVLGAFLNLDYFFAAFLNTIKMIYKIIPILILVFILQIVINYFVDSGKLKKLLLKSDSLRGWLVVIISGVLIGAPPYVLYPLLKDLKEQGMSSTHLAVFLYNRNVKIPFLPVMAFYFGFVYTVILSILIILGSILNGFLVGYLADHE